MTATFSVRNFEHFQHYKDRSPPWIKLYNDLLDNYEFGSLPDASKMHLVAIWLLASRSNNKLPLDPQWIAARINATEPVNLEVLASADFIVIDQPLIEAEQNASTSLAECLPRERGRDREENSLRSQKKSGANGHLPPEPTPRHELETVLDPERAAAVVEHRKKLRKPLTPHAARLLAGKFAKWSDPNAAADAMIARGWQGFEPSWMENQVTKTGPPRPERRDAYGQII